MDENEGLEIIEGFLFRPKMYTINGSDEELYAFITGYVSGLAKYNLRDPIVVAWSDFRQWVLSQYSESKTDGMDEILKRKSETLYQMFQSFIL